jgi:hypothetical protein
MVFDEDDYRDYRIDVEVIDDKSQYLVRSLEKLLPLGSRRLSKGGAEAECMTCLDKAWIHTGLRRPLPQRGQSI